MPPEEPYKRFKIEPLLGGLALLLLLVGCFFVLKPFMSALMWAMILAYSLHPLQAKFTRWFRGSRTLAACLVTLTITVVLAGPITLIGFSLAQDGKDLTEATRNWLRSAPTEAPTWIADAPIVGPQLAGYWEGFSEDRDRWMTQLEKEVKTAPRPRIVSEDDGGTTLEEAPPPVAVPVEVPDNEGKRPETAHGVVLLGQLLVWAKSWLLSVGLAVGRGVTQVVLSAFLAFFMLRDAPVLSERLSVGVERLAGARGKHLIKVAGDTVRGVIYGILGTAIAQALVAGLGFWIAGVPGAVLLSVLTFFFAVIPFGPPLIWLPAALWLFAQHQVGLGIFMLIWGGLGISMVDNFLRPFLISQGSKMPFVLIFCGVVGGALAFGLVGVFLGPTMLAVAFRLIEEWSSHRYDMVLAAAAATNPGLRAARLSDTGVRGGGTIGAR